MAVNAKSLLRRNETLKEDRNLWDGFYRDVVDYIRPRKQTAEESRTLESFGTSILILLRPMLLTH